MALAGSLGLLVIAEELLWRGLLLSALMCAGMGGVAVTLSMLGVQPQSPGRGSTALG